MTGICGALLAAAAVAIPLAAPASGGSADAAGKRSTERVKTGDDFFSPDELRVKKGTRVKWKWLRRNENPHNVTLRKAPNGVNRKDFKSPTATAGITFKRKLRKPGTYKFICTIHATTMKQTIRVKKPRR